MNQSVSKALKRLGYSPGQIQDIEQYAKGHGTLYGAPVINHETLEAKGLSKAEIRAIDSLCLSAFDIRYAVTVWSLQDESLQNSVSRRPKRKIRTSACSSTWALRKNKLRKRTLLFAVR